MKKENLYELFIGLSVAAYLWLGWNMAANSGDSGAPTLCLFKKLTGLPCPSCGTTRSLLALIDGHLVDSLLINPFGAALGLAMMIIPFWCIVDSFRGDDSFYRAFRRGERFCMRSRSFSYSALASLALNWIWNIAKGI